MSNQKKKAGRPAKYDWSKWDKNKTIKENCAILEIGYVYGRRQAHRKNLSFKRGPIYK